MTRLQDQHPVGVAHTTVRELRVVSDTLRLAFDAIFEARMKLNNFFLNSPIRWENADWNAKTYTVDNRVYSFQDWSH